MPEIPNSGEIQAEKTEAKLIAESDSQYLYTLWGKGKIFSSMNAEIVAESIKPLMKKGTVSVIPFDVNGFTDSALILVNKPAPAKPV